jgi:hypothetical protein
MLEMMLGANVRFEIYKHQNYVQTLCII